jgi:hypothetical protein
LRYECPGREPILDVLLGKYILWLIIPRSRRIKIRIPYPSAVASRIGYDAPRSALELRGARHEGGPKSSIGILGSIYPFEEPGVALLA